MTSRLRRMVEQLEQQNKQWPPHLVPVPREAWPELSAASRVPTEVYRSRQFLVQVFKEQHGVVRLSINRTSVGADGRWLDGITWDAIQTIKRELGMGEKYAVEVYPRDSDLIDVANMRHVWVMPSPLWHVGWFKDSDELTHRRKH